jgi:uncharacterized SAM-binding protein YcdF (DUF218 family)
VAQPGLLWPVCYTYGQSTATACEIKIRAMTPNLTSRGRPLLAIRPPALISLVLVLIAQLLTRDADFFANLLIRPLEGRFKRVDVTAFEELTGIIVLTGGDNRLAEAGHLARENPKLPIVVSGASGMSDVVAELGGGIDRSRIRLETRSSNTYENALYSAEMIKPKRPERWLLVTGASHMPRAIGSFRKAGFEVDPWPVYDLTVSGSATMDAARHEWLGLFAYWAFGRTSALLPG